MYFSDRRKKRRDGSGSIIEEWRKSRFYQE